VAIPLHKHKLKLRGYNQSEMIVKGLQKVLEIENLSEYVLRNKFTETQTKKTRFERNENVNKVFEISNETTFENKHILLIDDVITTGATIESCVNQLTQINNCKVSIGSLAFAHQGI
jgi:ComF family protein